MSNNSDNNDLQAAQILRELLESTNQSVFDTGAIEQRIQQLNAMEELERQDPNPGQVRINIDALPANYVVGVDPFADAITTGTITVSNNISGDVTTFDAQAIYRHPLTPDEAIPPRRTRRTIRHSTIFGQDFGNPPVKDQCRNCGIDYDKNNLDHCPDCGDINELMFPEFKDVALIPD